jgi:hypothetical protein
MDIIRCVVLALITWLCLSLGVFYVRSSIMSGGELSTFHDQILFNAIPVFLIYIFVAGISALVHPVPARYSRNRHAVAVLLFPVLTVVANGVLSLTPGEEGQPIKIVIFSTLVSIAGSIVGWKLADHIRPPRRQTINPYYE